MSELSAVPFSALPTASDGYTVLYENDQVCRSDKKLSELVGDKTSSFLTKEQGDSLYQEKGDYLVNDDITGKLDKSQYAVDSATFLTAHQVIPSGKWEDVSNVVISNSATWGTETDWTDNINAASAYAYEQAVAQIPAPFDPTFLSGEIDKKLDKTFSSNFYPMTGNPSGFLTEENLNDDYYNKTETSGALEIANALDLKQDLLVFVGTNNTIETINGSAISSQGGSTPTGLYVPLSAKFCTIGNDNKIAGGGYYGEFAQGQFNSAGEGCLVQGYKNSGNRYSISQGSANSAGIYCITVGNGNKANLDAISIGDVNSAENYAISVGSGNSAEIRVMCLGTANSAGQDSISVGQRNTAYCESIALGRINLANTDSIAIGSQNTATTIAVAAGTSNSAINYAFAFGGNSKSNSWSLANGGGVTANTYSLGVGSNVSSNYASLGVGGFISANQTACSIGMVNTALSASMAIGNYTSASNRSMSVGSYCSANTYSFALGSGNEADNYSVAIGKQNYAYAYSFAFGYNNSANWGDDSYNYNVTIGNNNTAFAGGYALGINNFVEVGGFAYGKNNYVTQGWAFGEGLKIDGNVFAIGEYNKASADVAFVIGYGDDDSNRKDIFKILSNNNTDCGIASGKDFWSENGAKLNLLAKLCSAISSHSTGKYNLILNNGDVEVEQIS